MDEKTEALRGEALDLRTPRGQVEDKGSPAPDCWGPRPLVAGSLSCRLPPSVYPKAEKCHREPYVSQDPRPTRGGS